MSEVEAEQFNRMIRQHTEMYEMLKDLKDVIKGDDWGRPGVLGEIKEIKSVIREHDKNDEAKFKQIFDFQKTQTLFVGWTGIALRVIGGGLMVLIGWIISIFFK